MISIEMYDDTHVSLVSDQPYRDKERIKMIPGARYQVHDHVWTAPLSWAACLQARGVFASELTIGPLLTDWAVRDRTERVDPAVAFRLAWDAEGDDDLYPFQRAGVAFLTFARKALLCDEMGTGKTPQTIRTLQNLSNGGAQVFPAVVVAPNNMTITWRKEFERWYPGVDAVVVKGSASKRVRMLSEKHDVYIINYEGLRSHTRLAPYGSVRLKHCIVCDPMLPDTKANQQKGCERCKKELNLITFKSIIVDEAHRMKDPKAKQTRACWALRSNETEFVYCLTGTAVANAPHDLWPALHMISPEEWPSRSKYIDRYCTVSFNLFGGMTVTGLSPATQDEFFGVVDPRMRRMPKAAVLPHLPAKTFTQRYVDMTPKQAKAYKQMEEGMLAVLDSGDEAGVTMALNPLVQMTRLSQFASAYAEVTADGHVVMAAPSNKVTALLEIMEDMGGKPVVVFAQSRQLIELAAAELRKKDVNFGMIVGGQSADEREIEKTKFQDGHLDAILCTIAAGGIGITLTRADTAIFLQRSWSMVENKQAEDRVHRIGSEVHDKVEIIDIISIDTLEDRQRVVLAGKEDRLEEVMRDKDTLKRVLGR